MLHKTPKVLCHSILAHANDGDQLILSGELVPDESYFGGKRKEMRDRGTAGKIPFFGIPFRKGCVSIEMVPHTRGAKLLSPTVKKV